MERRTVSTLRESGAPVSHAPPIRGPRDLLKLSLGALGVVYGDIGTSPLYAMRECFSEHTGIAPTLGNVLGILSLFSWTLLFVVVVKYLGFVMRADNQGEGGILALLALVMGREAETQGPGGNHRRRRAALVALGVFGAALLLADGMITPVISVLGALEGLEIATPVFRGAVVPIALAILVALFLVQKRGTAGIATVFGPAMLVWFVAIGAAGLPAILRHPEVLAAFDPRHGLRFLLEHRRAGLLVLGAVFLCVTGSEALYADMGHFGRRPIRFAWFFVAFPALLTNYYGQGALLVGAGGARVENPFYQLAPGLLLYPMLAIATLAAVIASQALISGAFSLARQATQLGLLPRLTVVYTSREARGQIYVPEINALLLAAAVLLVVGFRSSGALAAAYGIAVVSTMIITTLLLYTVSREIWGWSLPAALGLAGLFLAVDLPFLGANATKIAAGGWFPLVIALAMFVVMTSWHEGRAHVLGVLERGSLPLAAFVADVGERRPHRVRGAAVVLASEGGGTPRVLLHHFKHNQVLHETVVLLTVVSAVVPEVDPRGRVSVEPLGEGFWRVVARYGFMETPDVPTALAECAPLGLELDPHRTSYFLGRQTLLPTGRSPLGLWRERLFVLLSRNARPAQAFFQIPPNRVVELGAQIEL